MDCKIESEDKQDLFELAKILKDSEIPEQLKFGILWYARGQKDALSMRGDLRQKGSSKRR